MRLTIKPDGSAGRPGQAGEQKRRPKLSSAVNALSVVVVARRLTGKMSAPRSSRLLKLLCPFASAQRPLFQQVIQHGLLLDVTLAARAAFTARVQCLSLNSQRARAPAVHSHSTAHQRVSALKEAAPDGT